MSGFSKTMSLGGAAVMLSSAVTYTVKALQQHNPFFPGALGLNLTRAFLIGAIALASGLAVNKIEKHANNWEPPSQ